MTTRGWWVSRPKGARGGTRTRAPVLWMARLIEAMAHAVIVGVSGSLALRFGARASPIPSAVATRPNHGTMHTASALLFGLLPAALMHGHRMIRRRTRTARRLASRARVVERYLADAAAATAQPLSGSALGALRGRIEAALAAPRSTLALDLCGPPVARAAALLKCRVEALAAASATAAATATDASEHCRLSGTHGSNAEREAESRTTTTTTTADTTCKVCWDRPCDALLAPCGHLTACCQCLAQMLRTRAAEEREGSVRPSELRCPLCVAPVTDVLRVYMS